MKILAKCTKKDAPEKIGPSMFSFFKIYNIRMKTIRKLTIKDWSGYFFTEMVNITDIDPEYFLINDFKGSKDGSVLFNIAYCEEVSVPQIVFNNIECILRKSGIFSYIIHCETIKNKKMLDNYVKIVDKIKEEIWSFVGDEFWNEIFIMGKDFMRFRFKIDDELVYNQKLNIPVCVISLSSVIKKVIFIIRSLNYKIVFMKMNYLVIKFSLDKK